MKNTYTDYFEYKERKKSSIVFLSITLALLAACIGFFIWHTVILRNYELNYIKTEGTVIDVERKTSHSFKHNKSHYYLVVSYTLNGQEYTFTDRTGYNAVYESMVKNPVQIYVNKENPAQAEVVNSSVFASIISVCFLAFSCVTYAVGMNMLLSLNNNSSFKKRFLFVWGMEILLVIIFLLLFWLGLPNSGFGEVFVRIDGAIGACVILGLVVAVTLLDGFLTYKLRSKL